MLELMKKRSRIAAMWLAVINFAIVGAILVFGGSGLLALVTGAKAITKGTDYADMEGEYVSFVVDYPLEYYVERTEYNTKTYQTKTTGYGFLVYDANNDTFIGVDISANDKKVENADKLIEEAWEWVMDERREVESSFEVKGTLEVMEYEAMGYFKETMEDIFGDDSLTPEIIYCINVGKVKNLNPTDIIMVLAIGGIFLLLGISQIIRMFGSGYKKRISDYLMKNPQVTMGDLEADFAQARKIGKGKDFMLGKRWTFCVSGAQCRVIENASIVWAYYYQRTGKHYASQIHFYLADKTSLQINIPAKEEKELLDSYSGTLPQAVIGYSDELSKMYKKDYEGFLNLKYRPAKEADSIYGESV